MAFLEYLKASTFSGWLSISLAGFPTMIALHSVGMAVVVGLSLIVALRLHRPLPGIEPELLPRLLTVAVWGFTLNLVTGLLIFITRGPEYITSAIFLIKMALVVIGATALFCLRQHLRQTDSSSIAAGRPLPIEPGQNRAASALSLIAALCLFGAVITGRLIAYLSDLYR